MVESNQEGYQTLGWIISKSDQGLFLVVADEKIQTEIVDIYRWGGKQGFMITDAIQECILSVTWKNGSLAGRKCGPFFL